MIEFETHEIEVTEATAAKIEDLRAMADDPDAVDTQLAEAFESVVDRSYQQAARQVRANGAAAPDEIIPAGDETTGD